MKPLKRILWRLLCDMVDFLLLVVVITVLVKRLVLDPFDVVLAIFGGVLALYIFGTMWRIGAYAEDVNENVSDYHDRIMLDLPPESDKDSFYKIDTMQFVAAGFGIALAIVIFIVVH